MNRLSARFDHFLPASGRKKFSRLFLTGLSLLVTIAILGYLVYQQRQVLLEFPWQFRPFPAVLSFLLFTLNLTGSGALWGWILNTLGKHLPLGRHIRYFILSNVAKRLPGTIWYVASRAQMYREEGVEARFTSLASGIEMTLVVLSAALVSLLFGLPILLRYRVSPWVITAAVLAAAVLIQPRVVRWLFRLLKVEAASFGYFHLLRWLAGYVLSWVSGGVILFTIGNIITPLPWSDLAYFIGSWTIVGLLSHALLFSPTNFGITEIGISLLLTNILPGPVAVIITVLTRVLLILYEILLAAAFLAYGERQKPPLTQKD